MKKKLDQLRDAGKFPPEIKFHDREKYIPWIEDELADLLKGVEKHAVPGDPIP